MSKFVVSGVVGDEETVFVSSCGSAHNSSAPDGSLDDGDEGSKFALEDAVEVVRSSGCDKTISISKFGEHSDII